MNNRPEISIIVPVYKMEQYLDECINSILSQSFKDFELLLIDDGSPDRCPQMCDGYSISDLRVRTFHKGNGGLSSARNLGLDHAKGRYIMFVDSDDLLAKDALKHLYDEITMTNADAVLGKVIRFITGTRVSRPYTHLDTRKEMSGKETLEVLIKGTLLNISVCGGLYKREIWDELRMPVGYICEDWYVTPSIYLNAGKVIFIPRLFYLYRDNAESTMGGLMRKPNLQVIQVAEHCMSVIRHSDDTQLYKRTLWSNLRRVWKYVGIIYRRGSVSKDTEFLSECRMFFKKYLLLAFKSRQMNLQEMLGCFSFCYCEPLCRLLYSFKRIRKVAMRYSIKK